MASAAAEWVERNVRYARKDDTFALTPEQARCIDVISTIDTGPHNVRPVRGWGHVDFRHSRVVLDIRRDLATFDMAELTTLVIAAHRHHVRVEISATEVPAVYVFPDSVGQEQHDLIAQWEADDPDDAFPGQTIAALRIALHAREPEGRGWCRHPGLDELAARVAAVPRELVVTGTGLPPITDPADERTAPPRVVDLMAALEESLAQAKARRAP